MSADRNLLIGVLALQAQLINKDQFVEACQAFAAKPQSALGDVLVQRGWISATAKAGLEQRLGMFGQAGSGKSGRVKRMEQDRDFPQIPGYKIMELIGSGGMALVFKAQQLRLNRIVALKMVLEEKQPDPADLIRFMTEGEMLGRLQHPNIVQVHEVGKHTLRTGETRPYMALEFVDGGTLDGRLDRKPWPPRNAATMVETLARAVHAAHQQGIIHRDLKPANVLMTSDGVPKISDFGLARQLGLVSGLTDTGITVGTPSYMAPEQTYSSSQVGPAADIHALGAILYELLTGRPPFLADSAVETMTQVATAIPIPPSQLVPDVPPDLEAICLRCLAKEPKHRYETADILGDELHRFLQGDPVQARPLGILERVLRWCRRQPKAAATIVLLMFGLLVVSCSLLLRAEMGDGRGSGAEEGQRLRGLVLDMASRMNQSEALYKMAIALASSASKNAADPSACEQHAALAVDLLRQAQAAGYFKDAAHRSQLRNDPQFDVLRQREDFRKLAAELE